MELTLLLDGYSRTLNAERIEAYLAANSNLPGPRGNLELAGYFADSVVSYDWKDVTRAWKLAEGLAGTSPQVAPVDDPREFLAFCGAVSLGTLGSSSPALFWDALSRLRGLAGDERWRVREGVAMGLQRLLASEPDKVLKALESWIKDDQWLAMRAVVAGVAEPSLLTSGWMAGKALELHRRVFDRVLAYQDRRSGDFRALRQGLGYSLSVVVQAVPEEGFECMRWLAGTRNKDALWIVRENLKKNRLVRNFPFEVSSLRRLLEG